MTLWDLRQWVESSVNLYWYIVFVGTLLLLRLMIGWGEK